MKYILIFLCFCFLKTIYLVEQEPKKVEAFQFLFSAIVDKKLIKKGTKESTIVEILKDISSRESKKEIEYKIIFNDGSLKKEKIIGSFNELSTEEEIIDILKNILNIFDKKDEKINSEEIKQENQKNNEKLEEAVKKNYIAENSEKWKQEYIQAKKKEWEQKINLKQQLKETGLFFFGAGLGFLINRYLLKK